jgi:hypothetical protein
LQPRDKIAAVRALAIQVEAGEGPYGQPKTRIKLDPRWVLEMLWWAVQFRGRVYDPDTSAFAKKLNMHSNTYGNATLGWLAYWGLVERIPSGLNRSFWITEAGAQLLIELITLQDAGTLDEATLPSMDPAPMLQAPSPPATVSSSPVQGIIQGIEALERRALAAEAQLAEAAAAKVQADAHVLDLSSQLTSERDRTQHLEQQLKERDTAVSRLEQQLANFRAWAAAMPTPTHAPEQP